MLQIYAAQGNIDKARKLKNKFIADMTKDLERYPFFKKKVQDSMGIALAYILRDIPQY
jgi:hypothetical protein